MGRSFLGVIFGAIAYLLIFNTLAYSLAALWPDFLLHGRIYKTEGLFTFTVPMACCLLLFWALAGTGAGWLAMKIAKRRVAVWVLAGLVVTAVARIHFVLEWSRFPWWYDLWVVIQVVPVVMLGGSLAGAICPVRFDEGRLTGQMRNCNFWAIPFCRGPRLS